MKGRRFIAGAVCPQCAAIDRIAIEQLPDDKYRVCVACGFREAMVTPATRITSGRLDRSTRPPDDEQELERPVRIIDPLSPGKKPRDPG